MDDKPNRRRETHKELERQLGIQHSWWERNADTLLGCGCMGVLALIGLAIAAIGLAGAAALLKLAL